MERNLYKGFTLIELMIAMVVLAVLMGVVAPGFQKMIKDNRVKSEVFALRAALNAARSEAVTRRMPAVVCPSSTGTRCNVSGDGAGWDNWTEGFIAFTDGNNNGDFDGEAAAGAGVSFAGDSMIVARAADSAEYIDILYLQTATDAKVRFSSQGYALNSSGTFRICDDRGDIHGKGLILSPIGSANAATDTDGDDIINDHTGTELDCTP